MLDRKIVGITLVRNEERYLDRVLANILAFCDQVILADHGSGDETWAIATRWAQQHPEKIQAHRIAHPRESQDLIAPYINTPTWIFAVDGDEVYDALGLRRLRKELLAGHHDAWWRVFGNVLNCVTLAEDFQQAEGYLAPPCRSITKLYNFQAITAWTGVTQERLHGGTISFKEGYDDGKRLNLHETLPWDESNFRCLHLCFLPRSRTDRQDGCGQVARLNIADQHRWGPWVGRIWAALCRMRLAPRSPWKNDRYARGARVTKEVACFWAPKR